MTEQPIRNITKYKFPFTLLVDADKKVMTRYGAFGDKVPSAPVAVILA
ncbi:MAG: hypothetical protein ABIA59_10285 [Candidatus Latescibacterota bacterium]